MSDTQQEATTCPICLESLFHSQLPVASAAATSSSSSTTAAEAAAMMMIGSTVPCGHCLHVNCWDEWMASSLSSSNNNRSNTTTTTKCPLCNVMTSSFVRLYINNAQPVAAIPMLQEYDVDDDDIDIDLDSDNNHNEVDSNSNSDDDSADGDEDNQMITRIDLTVNGNRSSYNNDNTTQMIINLCDEIDTTVHAMQRATVPTRKKTKKNSKMSTIMCASQHDSHSSSSSQQQQQLLRMQKMNHKYRQYIRQLQNDIKVVQKQYETYYTEYGNLQSTVRNMEQEIHHYQTTITTFEEQNHTNQLRMDGIVLEKIQYQKQITKLRNSIQKYEEQIETIQAQSNTIQNQYQQQIKDLQKKLHQKDTSNMSEVQNILQERPKLLQQIYSLKETVRQLSSTSSSGLASTASARAPAALSSSSSSSTVDLLKIRRLTPKVVEERQRQQQQERKRSITSLSSTTSSVPPVLYEYTNAAAAATTSSKERKQLLRTLSEGIENGFNSIDKISHYASTLFNPDDNTNGNTEKTMKKLHKYCTNENEYRTMKNDEYDKENVTSSNVTNHLQRSTSIQWSTHYRRNHSNHIIQRSSHSNDVTKQHDIMATTTSTVTNTTKSGKRQALLTFKTKH